MRSTIDSAGRLFVPKALRERFHLAPGSEIEIEPSGDGVIIRTAGTAPSLVEENFAGHLEIVPLTAADYRTVVARVSSLGLPSGVIDDAIHLHSAEQHGCERLVTHNIADFERLKPLGITVVTP